MLWKATNFFSQLWAMILLSLPLGDTSGLWGGCPRESESESEGERAFRPE